MQRFIFSLDEFYANRVEDHNSFRTTGANFTIRMRMCFITHEPGR